MGFSVSGAVALLLVAFLISFGAFYTASTGAFSEIQDAQVDQVDRNVEAINTDVEIGSARYNESGENGLVIVANNTGATTIDINDSTLLVDGSYVGHWQADAEIDGISDRSLWIPQATLEITIERDEDDSDPERVKLVTSNGIAATATVEVFD